MSILEELTKAQKKAKPYAIVAGKEVYSYEAMQNKVQAEQAEEKITGKKIDLGEMRPSADGWGYTDIGNSYATLPPEVMFINRYKKEDDTYYVVTDYRAIQEQKSGQIYATHILALVLTNDKKEGLQFVEYKNIPSSEFVNDYTRELSYNAMAQVFELIGSSNISEKTKDEFD